MSRRYVPSAAAVRSMSKMSSRDKPSKSYGGKEAFDWKWLQGYVAAMDRESASKGWDKSTIIHPARRAGVSD
jgi:hypothetical protein